ncbi:MAG TPA: acyl-CoA thioesterase [Chitinophagaceae bacterium]|nr:acyl-CoA thioesterase [Chitinophagaceae bacterium]
MRWIRLLSALLAAKYRSRLDVTGISVINFRVWPLDIDASIMNHASLMTVMELGRIDFMVRSGFFALARKKKWYFPSAGISVQFIRPLKPFQTAQVHTRVFHVNESWIYLEQKVVRERKTMAVCIVKSKVKKGRDTVNTNEILKELNISAFPVEGRELIEYYEKENGMMMERLV